VEMILVLGEEKGERKDLLLCRRGLLVLIPIRKRCLSF
jgi:hypothetical protein